METKHKNVVRTLTLFVVLGITTLFQTNVDSYTFSETMKFKPVTPNVPELYTGPQTVQALMTAFDLEYNRRHSKTTVSISGRKSRQLTVTEIDARYPRAEWLQALLHKGITIKNFHEYASYLAKRHTLAFLEDNPDLRKTGFLDIPSVDDWLTYKASYIDKLVDLTPPKAPTSLQVPTAPLAPIAPNALITPPAPIAPNALIAPRAPQLFNSLTEREEITLSSLQSLVNQLEQTVEDLERQNRQDMAEQVKEALEHAKKILEQIETGKPLSDEPKQHPKKTSRYPPL